MDAGGRVKHDSREGGGRAKQEARAEDARTENRSVYDIHEESLPRERSECFGYSSTELMYRMYGMPVLHGAKTGDAAGVAQGCAVYGPKDGIAEKDHF
jgi:hypothetical protein